MADAPSHARTIDPATVELLACPVCHGALREESTNLVCCGCARAYPIVDGIPVLIAGRAVQSPSSEITPK
ncbi:MAG TPA: Trm112 family protein [Terracidiphilus sp.]|nr:Trm112 family protein [Terracidiphilus sp.]